MAQSRRAAGCPLGDDAMIAIRSFDVLTAHSPLVGMPSSGPTGVLKEQTYHLGPLLSALRPAGALSRLDRTPSDGGSGQRRVRGRGPSVSPTGAAAGRSCSLSRSRSRSCSRRFQPRPTARSWNPSAPLLPFTLLIFLAWSVACGDFRLLPLTVLVGELRGAMPPDLRVSGVRRTRGRGGRPGHLLGRLAAGAGVPGGRRTSWQRGAGGCGGGCSQRSWSAWPAGARR